MEGNLSNPEDIKERIVLLEKLLCDPYSDLNIDRVLDVFVSAVLDNQRAHSNSENSPIRPFSERFASAASRLQCLRRQRRDFSFIASLGRGAYGRVNLVRETATGRICAMKILKKSKMLSQHADFWAEREIMARSTSPWLVRLFYAFQDLNSLYMVMEYLPGGTLVSWMDEVEVISETVCRFYAAEIVLALADLHAMGFIHRDLKPDNLLLDMSGHLKLADFGTCVHVDPNTKRVRCESAVGTPDYISPEVLFSQSSGGGEYGFPVDWWALGVLVYEMICGETPFYSDDLVTTYSKIMSHTSSLHVPDDILLTDSCLNFINTLLSPEPVRLGSTGGASEVRAHAWFSTDWVEECRAANLCDQEDENYLDWDWTNLRACPAPFQPKLSSETDTSYFQVDDENEEGQEEAGARIKDGDDVSEDGDVAVRKSFTDSLSCANSDVPKADAQNGKLSPQGSKAGGRLSDDVNDEEALADGKQLSFAGFTFSRPQSHRLALFSGSYLVPPSFSNKRASVRLQSEAISSGTSTVDVIHAPEADALGDRGRQQQQLLGLSVGKASTPSPTNLPSTSPVLLTSIAVQVPHISLQSTVSTDGRPPEGGGSSDMPIQEEMPQQVDDLEHQLAEAHSMVELRTKESLSLATRLCELESTLEKTERQLMSSESRFAEQLRDSDRRIELARLETASLKTRLEGEISKWRTIAEAERSAREAAETQKAKAADLLAKRATDMADRLTGSRERRQISLPVEMPTGLALDSLTLKRTLKESSVGAELVGENEGEKEDESDTSTSPATELLLKRIQELVERAQQADEQLQIERCFSNLHREACEEKKDQLLERDRQIASLCEALQAVKQSREQTQMASRHALMQEQERSAQYLECLKAAEKSSEAANRRAQIAGNEAAALREQVAQLKDELAAAVENLASEKLKCNAAVNKIQQILSGENADALELMMLSELESLKAVGGSSGSSANKKTTSKKFTSQQHLFRQMDRKYKRLVSDMEQLQTKHRAEMKEVHSRLAASQEAAQKARNQATRLADEVSFLQSQLSAAKAVTGRPHTPSSITRLRNAATARLYPSSSKNTLLPTNSHPPTTYSSADVGVTDPIVGDSLADETGPDERTDQSPQAVSASPYFSEASNQHARDADRQLEADSLSLSVADASMYESPSSTALYRVSSLSANHTFCAPAAAGVATAAAVASRSPISNLHTPLLVNFNLSGQLEVPAKPGRRKKLTWEPRFAKVTVNRFLLWDVVKATPPPAAAPADTSTPSLLSASGAVPPPKKHSKAGPNLLLDLPLAAILHVRSVTSCDVLHAPPEDLPKIFQIIFDQCRLQQQQSDVLTGKTGLPLRSSSPGSKPHAVTPPPKSAPPTGLAGVSRTLPRKLSFSSSSTFSTTGKSAIRKRNGSTHFIWGGVAPSLSSPPPPPTPIPAGHLETDPVTHLGHHLQPIQFRVPAVCELCRRACWHVISPPPALQCLNCQVKLHAYHLEKRDHLLRPCGKSTAILLFRTASEEEKSLWLSTLLASISSFSASGGGGGAAAGCNNSGPMLASVTSSDSSSSISLCTPTLSHQFGMTGDQRRPLAALRSQTLPFPPSSSSHAAERTFEVGLDAAGEEKEAAAQASVLAKGLVASPARVSMVHDSEETDPLV